MTHEPKPSELHGQSDALLGAVDRLRNLEFQKRTEQISTPRFHDLANEVEDEARRVFRAASVENDTGDEMHTQDVTIDEAPDHPSA